MSVTFDQPQPQVSRGPWRPWALDDPDGGVADVSVAVVARADSKEGPWTDIDGATQEHGRTPDAADDGMYLRATASYTDAHGAISLCPV